MWWNNRIAFYCFGNRTTPKKKLHNFFHALLTFDQPFLTEKVWSHYFHYFSWWIRSNNFCISIPKLNKKVVLILKISIELIQKQKQGNKLAPYQFNWRSLLYTICFWSPLYFFRVLSRIDLMKVANYFIGY